MGEIEERGPSGVAVSHGILVYSPSWEKPSQEAVSKIFGLMGKKKHGVNGQHLV